MFGFKRRYEAYQRAMERAAYLGRRSLRMTPPLLTDEERRDRAEAQRQWTHYQTTWEYKVVLGWGYAERWFYRYPHHYGRKVLRYFRHRFLRAS